MEPLDRTRVDPTQAGTRPPSEPQPELRNIGEYRILRKVGEGGMGAVYLAYHDGQDQRVAIKVLADSLASTQGYIDRFRREAKSMALLSHPSIVRSLETGQDQATGKHYMVLEFVDGASAQALLERYGQLAVGDAVHIALDIARALEHAHSRNIIHRDIKPDNILITRAGVSKLADLGLAKRLDEASHLTAARQGFGTPYYMPYEQAINAKHADGRSDVYALGATLYHLLTGEVPFKGDSHLEVVEKKDRGEFTPASLINSRVPRLLDQILAKMMARHPRDRYQTASELIVDLERSRLAAPVPSYADPDLALQDPWVRACLASSAQPTLPDLSQASPDTPAEPPTPTTGSRPSIPVGAPAGAPPEPLWIVRYRTRDGRWRRTRLTRTALRERLERGRALDGVEVCADPTEGFRPLTEFEEFRGLVSRQATASVAEPFVEGERRRLWKRWRWLRRLRGLAGRRAWRIYCTLIVLSIAAVVFSVFYVFILRGN